MLFVVAEWHRISITQAKLLNAMSIAWIEFIQDVIAPYYYSGER